MRHSIMTTLVIELNSSISKDMLGSHSRLTLQR